MKIIHKIAKSHILSSHDFKFISYSIKLSILGLMLGIASLNVISSFSQGFKNSIRSKLTALDGHLRITPFGGNGYLSDINIEEITDSLNSISEIIALHPFIDHKAMIQKKGMSEGLIIYGTSLNALKLIYHLEDMLTEGSIQKFNDGIIIGSSIAEKLSVRSGDNINVIDIERFIQSGEISGKRYKIVAIFKSGFAEYDRLLAFLPLEKARSLFHLDQQASGIICEVTDPDRIESIDEKVIDKLGYYRYLTTTWRERHFTLYNWLNVYDLPIRIVIFFITLLAIFNISVSLYMTIKEKNREISILRAIGFRRKRIRNLFILEGFYIGGIGATLGVLLTLIILFIQYKFRVISLSSDIYFIDYLPVFWSLKTIFMYPVLAVFISVIFSIIPSVQSQNLNIIKAVNYE